MCSAIFSSFNTHTDDYSSSKGKQNVNDEVNLQLLFKILYRVSKLLLLNLTTVMLGQNITSLETKP